ncbi:hypothetical protein FRC07_012354, partial [Ceratobasidium sp. 392]
MGSQHSTARSLAQRNGQPAPIRPRPLSRLFRPRASTPNDVADNDDDAQSLRAGQATPPVAATAQEEEAVSPPTDASAPPRQDNMGRRPDIVPGHGLVRAHDSHDQQAQTRPPTSAQAAEEGSSAADRARCQAVAAASSSVGETAAPTGTQSPAPGSPIPLALADALGPVSAAGTTADDLDVVNWPQTPATTTSPASAPTSVPAELPALELPERDQQRPVLAPPTLTSRSASAFNTAPSTPTTTTTTRIPRTLPLGTTMIVQGLVQTIEVPRPPPPRTPTTTVSSDNHVIPSEPVRQTRPSSEHAKPSNPAIAGGDAPLESPTSGGSPSGSATPPTSISAPSSSGPTPTTTPPDTLPSIVSASSNVTPPAPSPPQPTSSPAPLPQPASRTSSPPPSSTDVLGLLLSIAAQATAEALVPWSVPPRSRNLNTSTSSSGTGGRDGIANGLAAAFSALAAGGVGTRGAAE